MTIQPDKGQESQEKELWQQANGKTNDAIDNGQITTAVTTETIEEYRRRTPTKTTREANYTWLIFFAVLLMVFGLFVDVTWISLSATLVALLLALRIVLPAFRAWLSTFMTSTEKRVLIASIALILATLVLFKYIGVYHKIGHWLGQFEYDEFGSWAEWVGALGQILIAMLAVYVAWQQYVISKDLTIQQNRITQQQTIDAYFQGIAELALNDQGLLEDWPQERAFAEGRTAAILSSVDASGKAKILRFLSQSRLLTPLLRDNLLGRVIFDGLGGYAEDRVEGLRVINLGVMLAGSDISGQDLRWTDLSEANMVRINLSHCDLVKANLSRTVLYEANLVGADVKGARFFYGSLETASPRSRTEPPNYETGEYTGVVAERADCTDIKRLNEEQRCYLCAWGGEFTRSTIPGGCEGIPNRLGR
jgi:uncharacterized protein YjbI with pentapeptide repeats